MNLPRRGFTWKLPWVLTALCLWGCAEKSLVPPPVYAPPQMSPQPYVERAHNGAIFQPGMASQVLFSNDRRPRHIGDTLKIDISEKFSASRSMKTETQRNNKVSTQGPGSGEGGGLFKKLLGLKANASGSDSFDGSGNADNRGEFTGQLAATVINVLPNGHLVVAGERSLAQNGGQQHAAVWRHRRPARHPARQPGGLCRRGQRPGGTGGRR
jgi:flagellar L-ring protein precursor FlgH